jgi:hypothetical protein
VDPVLGGPVAEGAPQHGPGGRERRRTLALEAELEQGLGDGREVGRGGGQEQVDGVLAGQAGHRRAAHVLGRGGWPAGGDEGDQAPGDLGGVRVGLVDLDRHAPVAADRGRGRREHAGVGGVRVGDGQAVVAAVVWSGCRCHRDRGSYGQRWAVRVEKEGNGAQGCQVVGGQRLV